MPPNARPPTPAPKRPPRTTPPLGADTPSRGGAGFAKPENALKRSNELYGVGQKRAALQALHDVITSRRHRTWQPANEKIMLRYVELCVELKTPRMVKDGLISYKNSTQHVNVQSLDDVIKHLLKVAHARAEQAVGESDAKTLEVADLEIEATPEEIMMSYVSMDKEKERTDREMVQPWVKFLWEAYRSCMDVLRNHDKLEHLYAALAHRAYNFCVTFKRNPEFRRLCDLIRLHLNNLNKFKDARNRPDLSKPETLKFYLDTRFEQLRCATKLGMYQEAFRTVEDIHNLTTMVKKTPRPQMMAQYYARLLEVFWNSDSPLYHAYSWYKLYTITKTYNKNIAPADLALMATNCILSMLCVMPYDKPSISGIYDEELMREKASRVSSILGFTLEKTNKYGISREALREELVSKGLLEMVPAEVKALYLMLEKDFNPMGMYGASKPLIEQVGALPGAFGVTSPIESYDITRYTPLLEKLAVVKMIKQLGQIYSSMKLSELSKMLNLSFSEVEKLIVDTVKGGYVAMQIDHRHGYVTFTKEEIESNDPSKSIDLIAQRLNTALRLMAPEVAASTSDVQKLAIQRMLTNVEQEHKRCLARKVLIERRKEEQERNQQEQEREEELRRAAQEKQREEEEKKRLEAEVERRQQERIMRDMEERELEETKMLMEAAGKKWDLKEGEVVDKAKLQQEAIRAQIKERQEAARKLQRSMRQLDHYQRAKRESEVEVIERLYKQKLVDDEQFHNSRKDEFLANHRRQWGEDVADKARTARMLTDVEGFTVDVLARRQAAFDQACEERLQRMADKVARRRADRHLARQRAFVEREREEYFEAKEAEEAERRAREEAERQREREEEERRRREEEDRARGGDRYGPPRGGRGDDRYGPPRGGRDDRGYGRDDRDRYGGPPRRGGYGDRDGDRYGPPRGGRDDRDRYGGPPRRGGYGDRDGDRYGGPPRRGFGDGYGDRRDDRDRRDGPPPSRGETRGPRAPPAPLPDPLPRPEPKRPAAKGLAGGGRRKDDFSVGWAQSDAKRATTACRGPRRRASGASRRGRPGWRRGRHPRTRPAREAAGD